MKIKSGAAITVVASIALAGCGSSSGESGPDPAASMYTWISNENDRAQWQAFIDAAQEKNPNFNLALEGPSFHDYWTKIKTRMSSDGAPCIITTQAARAQELEGLLAPLDELAKKNNLDISMYNEAMIEGMTIEGSLRAIPYDAEPMVLYYNKDLFQAAGLEEPTLDYTRDQFLSDAQALTDKDQFGLAVPPQFGSDPTLPIAFADNHYPVKDGALNITDPGFVEAAQWTFDLGAESGVAKAPQSSDDSSVAQQQFMSGKAAMIIDGPWQYEQFVTETEGDVGIAVIPSTSGDPTGMIQGSGFGIAETCEDKEAAFRNIMKITTPEVIGQVGATRGTVPSIDSAIDDWAAEKPASDVAVIKELLENGEPLQTTDSWNQVSTLYTQYSVNGYRGSDTASSILKTISDSVK